MDEHISTGTSIVISARASSLIGMKLCFETTFTGLHLRCCREEGTPLRALAALPSA